MRVKCIDDKNFPPDILNLIKEYPVQGQRYTVRKRNHSAAGLGYVLEELKNPPLLDGTDVGFAARRFAPDDEPDVLDEIIESLKEAHVA